MVWRPAPCFFLCSRFFFPVCSSSPMSASITGVGVRGFALCASILLSFALFFPVCSSSPMRASIDPFFLPSFHFLVLSFFSPFLALVRADPALAGVGSRIIYIRKTSNPTSAGSAHINAKKTIQGRKRKGTKHKRPKPSTPSRAIDALIGDEEQK